MEIALAEGLPQWFTALMYSPWLYVIVGGIFLVIFLCTTAGLLRHRKKGDRRPVETRLRTISEYDVVSMLDALKKEKGYARTLLLAAASPRELPVTIAIKAAMRLAENSRCLLIDLDIQRDALSHVFGIDVEQAATVPVPTSLDNLHVWPAHKLSQLDEARITSVLSSAGQNYDVILFNAPGLIDHPMRTQIIRAADGAIIFAHSGQSAEPLRQLLASGSCSILTTLTSGREDG